MEKFTRLCLRLDASANAVLKDSRIFIAVETWRDDFESQLGKSLTDEATLAAYEREVESFTTARSQISLR